MALTIATPTETSDLDVAAHVADACPAGRPIPMDPDAALFGPEAAYLAGLSVRTLEKLRVTGGGPAFMRLGRATRYRRADLIAWMERHRRKSTSDPGEAA